MACTLVSTICFETEPFPDSKPKLKNYCKIIRIIASAVYTLIVLAYVAICVYGYVTTIDIGTACSNFRLNTIIYAALFLIDLICMLIKYINQRKLAEIEPELTMLDSRLLTIVVLRITVSGFFSCLKFPSNINCAAYQTTILWKCFYIAGYYNFIIFIATYFCIVVCCFSCCFCNDETVNDEE